MASSSSTTPRVDQHAHQEKKNSKDNNGTIDNNDEDHVEPVLSPQQEANFISVIATRVESDVTHQNGGGAARSFGGVLESPGLSTIDRDQQQQQTSGC